MSDHRKQQILQNLPSIASLLETQQARRWLQQHPRPLVADCLREAVGELRQRVILGLDAPGPVPPADAKAALDLAGVHLARRTEPQVRGAINAAGIILHTALGRAVWPESVVDSMAADLKGYVTLATDRESGKRSERDNRVEPLLKELTGAEAATVVNNNAAATLIVLAALCAEREVIVSRGQLIEIGGSFRLPDVMAQSGAKLVEVGATNRTHLRDYEQAVGEDTAAIMKVHPSNYRIQGFHKEVPIEPLVDLGHRAGLMVIDDLGAGALVGLQRWGLPHEPTAAESIAAGADVALFSADKLIGASQGGIIVGRSEAVERIRAHPLARALRVDKTCLMALERTLMLFRDPDQLADVHPLYRMLAAGDDELADRAERLAREIRRAAGPDCTADVVDTVTYLGSGSLPMEQLRSRAVRIFHPDLEAGQLARRLRADDACIFSRVERDAVLLDVRTLWEHQLASIAAAVARVTD